MSETPEDTVRTILNRLREGGLWQPAGLGLSYVRTGEESIMLGVQENTAIAAQARIRMRKLVESIGWRVDESDVTVVDVAAKTPEERSREKRIIRENVAKNWKCACGTPLVSFPLEDGVWTHDGQEEMLLPNGETEMVEQWSVVITCPVCKACVPCEPYDYSLLVDDELMNTYRTSEGTTHVILTRDEIIKHVDGMTTSSIHILGTNCPIDGDLLPPRFRGKVVLTTAE